MKQMKHLSMCLAGSYICTRSLFSLKVTWFSIIIILMLLQYNSHFIRGAKTKKNLSRSVSVLSLFWIYFFCGRSFKRLTTSSAKATSTKLGTCSRTKGTRTRSMTAVDPMRGFANFLVESFWKTTWDLCLLCNFLEREAKRASFSLAAPHLPLTGRREIDAYESGEPIEPFDISLRNKLCSWFDQSFSSSFNWIKNLLCFFFNLNLPFSHRE